MQRWTASAASYQLVLIPLVTVVVSAWLQDDPITPAFAAGSVLVLLGVYVGALASCLREAPSPQPIEPQRRYPVLPRRGGRAVECGGLENR